MPADVKLPDNIHSRFFVLVEKTNWCWYWRGSVARHGYGGFQVNGRKERAHRVSWTLHFGSIPEGRHVLHHCDNRSCVRPSHLFLGDEFDNMRDAKKKGRLARGEHHGRSKLNERFVREIREEYREKRASMPQLARRYGVSVRQVCNVIHEINWRTGA